VTDPSAPASHTPTSPRAIQLGVPLQPQGERNHETACGDLDLGQRRFRRRRRICQSSATTAPRE